MIYLAFIVILLISLVLIYFSVRNNRVYKFQVWYCGCAFNVINDFLKSFRDDENEFNKRFEEYREMNKIVDRIVNKSYNEMLYSFKPLKLECWFSEEEIEFINRGRRSDYEK